MDRPAVVVIGSGNVATHLARSFDRVARVVQVCSRTLAHASTLAASLSDCEALDDVASLTPTADLYVMAVSDDAIARVAAQMPRTSGVVVHTSGSTPIDAIAGVSQRYGVMYPLQTFSAGAKVDVSDVPFFNEGASERALAAIDSYASLISRHIYHADSCQRQTLHIAAVFACNFTNHMLAIADRLLKRDGYGLEVLRPLLYATIDKAFAMPPVQAQTGPASRGDTGVVNRHAASLPGDLAQIYMMLSKSIMHYTDTNE